MVTLESILEGIKPVDEKASQACLVRVNALIKPRGSLGSLEDIVVKLAGIQRKTFPEIHKKAVIVCAGDHKIIEEGVATSEKEITKIQAINMTRGFTGVCALAKNAGAEVIVVDVGIDGPVNCDKVIDKKVKNGADNFMKGPAMSSEEARQGIIAGFEVAEMAIKSGADLLATGEMGIGNTSPSAAIVSVMTGHKAEEVTGIGANLPLERLRHKAKVIQEGIAFNNPNSKDPLGVLAKVGGLEIAGMCGVMLAGAHYGVAVVIDGFISSAAALIAIALNANVKDYLLGSHNSLEQGAKIASRALNVPTYLDMNMRLGEGSGAVLMFGIIEASIAMNNEMITFEEAGFIVD